MSKHKLRDEEPAFLGSSRDDSSEGAAARQEAWERLGSLADPGGAAPRIRSHVVDHLDQDGKPVWRESTRREEAVSAVELACVGSARKREREHVRRIAGKVRALATAARKAWKVADGLRFPRREEDEVTRFARLLEHACAAALAAEEAIPSFAGLDFDRSTDMLVENAPSEAQINATLAQVLPDLGGARLRDVAHATGIQNLGRPSPGETASTWAARKRWEKAHERATPKRRSVKHIRSRNVK